jgi:nicotinate-nucleotide pyrophosphorylase (carboxylating)
VIDRAEVIEIIERTLHEDLGEAGDITTQSVISELATVKGHLVNRESGVIAGIGVARSVFDVVDPDVSFMPTVEDGDRVSIGTVLATVSGSARSILTAERTALNLMGRMSGVATETARLVEEVRGTGASISDTRKTMPGLRVLDKYAVAQGGGINHRMGLYDAVIIKDNHIVAAGDIGAAVAAARHRVGPDVMVEVEVESLHQLREVLNTTADRVLLDNMDLAQLRAAVEMVDGAITTEASGGVTLRTIRSIAETGVDVISVGWITHSPPQLDIGLDFLS